MVTSPILLTCILDYILTRWEEFWCWSLLELEGCRRGVPIWHWGCSFVLLRNQKCMFWYHLGCSVSHCSHYTVIRLNRFEKVFDCNHLGTCIRVYMRAVSIFHTKLSRVNAKFANKWAAKPQTASFVKQNRQCSHSIIIIYNTSLRGTNEFEPHP